MKEQPLSERIRYIGEDVVGANISGTSSIRKPKESINKTIGMTSDFEEAISCMTEQPKCEHNWKIIEYTSHDEYGCNKCGYISTIKPSINNKPKESWEEGFNEEFEWREDSIRTFADDIKQFIQNLLNQQEKDFGKELHKEKDRMYEQGRKDIKQSIKKWAWKEEENKGHIYSIDLIRFINNIDNEL